ncbi:MAG: hypothetical protein R3C45_19370 [Phycisphaerales bacterium]
MLWIKKHIRDVKNHLRLKWQDSFIQSGWRVPNEKMASTELGLKSLKMLSGSGRVELDPVARIDVGDQEVMAGVCRAKKRNNGSTIDSMLMISVKGTKSLPTFIIIRSMRVWLSKRLEENVSGYTILKSPSWRWRIYVAEVTPDIAHVCTEVAKCLIEAKVLQGIECYGNVIAAYGLFMHDESAFRKVNKSIEHAFKCFELCGARLAIE